MVPQVNRGELQPRNGSKREATRELRVLVADGKRMVLESVAALLSSEPDIVVVGIAQSGGEVLARARAARPSVAVVDIFLPRLNGVDVTPLVVQLGTKVIAIADYHDDILLNESVRAGASAFLSKDVPSSELVAAVRDTVRRPDRWDRRPASPTADSSRPVPLVEQLSLRERHILQLIAEGRGTKEIADLLGIAVKTTEHCRERLSRKLGTCGVAALTRFAIRSGLVRV